MSLNTNINPGTLIDFSNANPVGAPKELKIVYRNGIVENLTSGKWVSDGVGGYKQVTSVTETAELSRKKVTLSNDVVVILDASNTLNIGDSITINNNNTVTIKAIEDTTPGTMYTVAVDGGGSFDAGGIIVG